MYYFLIIIILLFYYVMSSQETSLQKEKKDDLYSIIICAILVLLAAFRSDAVGADTAGYRMDYQILGSFHSIQDLIDRYTVYYLGYFLTSKLFHLMGMPVQVWFGFIEAFYLYSLMKLVNRFSKEKVFSLLVFTTIGLFSFSLAGLKQTLAMSLMMWSFLCFIDKKYLLSFLFAFLTYYTHQTALILLGAFPLYYIRKIGWLALTSSIALCILIYYYGFLFMEKMVEGIGNERWESYLVNDSQYSSVTFIFYSVITFVSGITIKNYNLADPAHAFYFLCLSIVGCGLQILAGISPSLFRLAYLYTPFMMILLPNATYYSNNKQILRLFLMGSIIFYFLYTHRNVDYTFVDFF